MSIEPRIKDDYDPRQTQAAYRVLIDIGQILASFGDCLVVIGGWVPDLLIPDAAEAHVGSIDVDLALDAAKLNDGRYAEIIKLLLDTQRYTKGEKDFQLVVQVDIEDGKPPLTVDVEFLAPADIKFKKNKPKLLEDFRVLKADGCATAFHAPIQTDLTGKNVEGADNSVSLLVASIPDSLVMKAHAIGGRDKPKDVYDLCYELQQFPGGMGALAENWKARLPDDADVQKAVAILKEKFRSVDWFGPRQLAVFQMTTTKEERDKYCREAYELVHRFLSLVEPPPPPAS